MNRRLGIAAALAAGAVVALFIGCQTYDFQVIQPLALTQVTQTADLKPFSTAIPSMMFLIDRSGSMSLPFSGSNDDGTPNTACYATPGNSSSGYCGDQFPNPHTRQCDIDCPSRWDVLSETTADFLNNNGTIGRMGVTFFPHLENASQQVPECSPPTGFAGAEIAVQLPTDQSDAGLVDAAQAIETAIQNVLEYPSTSTTNKVAGGTPTGGSVTYVGQNSAFLDAGNNYIILMTDGLPNCNGAFPGDYTNNAVCQCVDSDPNRCNAGPSGNLDCNDSDATSQAMSTLASQGVKTVVVGYGNLQGGGGGDLTSGVAGESLQKMAVAGGFNRLCYADGGECAESDVGCYQGASNAPTAPCAQQYFAVQTKSQLAHALYAITHGTTRPGCVINLNPVPTDPKLISLVVKDNGVTTLYPYDAKQDASSPWLLAGGQLTLQDPICASVKDASHQVSFVLRVLDVLQ